MTLIMGLEALEKVVSGPDNINGIPRFLMFLFIIMERF